jgi:hypothetical protein
MTESQRILRWQLDEDGGGTAWLFEDVGQAAEQHRFVFNSLDELPPDLAAAIREDGGTRGEITVP